MALLSIIVRQAQYSGDRSVTSQYCTYVTLTLDRCRTTTVTVKGHNPHWEQDYLFETQNTSRGLLIEVWKQDDYLHTPIGCYWLPLNMVRYSNEHTTGLWASLGSELFIEEGLIVKSVNSTGHFLLYDARLEDPDDRRVEHANVDNENVEDYYPANASRRVNESGSKKVAPAAIPAEPNGEWYRYENYQDGYRSSSSENVRSDLDYSYSETSNHIDRRSCYESSEKSLEKEQYSHDERNEQTYYSEYEQSENYKSTNSYGKRSSYENQADGDEQWVSDEYADEQTDEIYQNSHHDYGPSDGEYNFSYHKSSHFKRTENNTKRCYNQDGIGEDVGSYEDDELEEDEVDEEDLDDEPDDGRYYENNSYVYVQSPPTTKRILPSIPSFDGGVGGGGGGVKKPLNYRKNNHYYDQYKDKNSIGENYPPRVPSIYVDSPTLSPCLSASKSTSFDYRDHNSDDSASIYQYSDNSTTAQGNEKTYNHCKTSTIHRYNRRHETSDHNFSRINDGYVSNEEEADEYGDYVNDENAYPNDYYDYDDDYAKNENDLRDEQRSNDDDINNNQLVTSHRSIVRDYAKKLCSPFTKESPAPPPVVPDAYEPNRRDAFVNRAKSSSLTRQSSNFPEQFEWTFNELPEEEYDHFDTAGTTALVNHRASLPEVEPVPSVAINTYNKSQIPSFYNPIDSILEEDYNEEEDDVTLVSPINSSSLSPRSMNYLSQEKDHDTQETYDKDNSLESYREDLGKQSPTSETDHFNDSSMLDHSADSYHSSYPAAKKSIDDTHSLHNDDSLLDNDNEPYSIMDKLEVVQPEPRKSSLQKEENTAEMRRMRARNRWHTAYNKIVHQLSVSINGGRFRWSLRASKVECFFFPQKLFAQFCIFTGGKGVVEIFFTVVKNLKSHI